MPHRLLIRLHAGGAAEWLALARDGSPLQGPATGLPSASVAEQVVLLLPSEDVLLLQTPRIGRSRAELAQALPFAIEEQLAAPVETQHVAFDDRAGALVDVAVIDRARLQAALQRLRAAGIEPDAAYADAQLLPWADDEASVLAEGGRRLLRWGRADALVLGADELADHLQLLADAGVTPARLRWVGPAAAEVPAGLAMTVQHEPAAAALPWLASRLPQVSPPNLLQGEFAPPRRRGQSQAAWRLAAAVAAVAVLLAFAHAFIERAQLQAQIAAHEAEMEALLRHAMPGIQRVVDPVAQLRIELERGGRDSRGALPMLSRVAPIIAGSGRHTLESIEFRGGVLELVIVAEDVAALDQLRERIAATPPLSAELASAVPGNRGVEGRLRVRGGSAG